MSVALVTGSSGLIGSETVRFCHAQGMRVVGIDNNLREHFFGPDGSTLWNTQRLQADLKNFTHHATDIRDQPQIERIFSELGKNISLIVHTAAQPSHDWAAREPLTDFSINATGTLLLLEATRKYAPDAVFIVTSTNKVYGDNPNHLPLVEQESRWELDPSHRYAAEGIDESMSLDQTTHSLFGVSKTAADLLSQEYGRYFGLKTVTLRGGCLTGPAHSGAQLHGFLAYLVKCAVQGRAYEVFGYKAKQVRDNIHSHDFVRAIWHCFKNPRPGSVYNMGGSRINSCSMLEAIALIRELSGKDLQWRYNPQARAGDHMWWISDVRKFKHDYPEWNFQYDLRRTLSEIIAVASEKAGA